MIKNPPANAGDIRDLGSVPGSGRPPGEGNGSPLQYPCLENPMDRGAWRAAVHGVQSWTQLKHTGHNSRKSRRFSPPGKMRTITAETSRG